MKVGNLRLLGRMKPEFQCIDSVEGISKPPFGPSDLAVLKRPLSAASSALAKGPSRHQCNQVFSARRILTPHPRAGFLLVNAFLSPVSFNREAVQILSYQEKLVVTRRANLVLARKIRSSLISRQSSSESPFVTGFRSGRRSYLCHAFIVET